nr:hypothetical protein [uncultured Bdellovibrio sp.]
MEAKQIIKQVFKHQWLLLDEIETEGDRTLEKIFFETREFLIIIREWKKEDEILTNCLLELDSFKKELLGNNFYTKPRIKESISLTKLIIELESRK